MRFLLYFTVLAAPLYAGVFHDGWPPAAITVLLDFENSHSDVPLHQMETELSTILSDAGLHLDLRLKDELPPNPEFGELVIFKMKGHCGADALPVGALSDERGPLAMTYSSDGSVLAFGAVECDKVRQSLLRMFGDRNLRRHEQAYGKALGRVVAHEMYHMIANSPVHTRGGVTKESLTPRELSEGSLKLPGNIQGLLRKHFEDETLTKSPQ